MIWNRVFWVFFVLIGISIIIANFGSMIFLDILLGLIVIALGVQMLSFELMSKDMERRETEVRRTVNKIIDWANSLPDSEDGIKKKIKEMESNNKEFLKSIEERNEKIIKKIINLENDLREISRAFVSKEVVRSGRGKNRIVKDRK